MIRLNRWVYAFVVLVVGLAVFVDIWGYAGTTKDSSGNPTLLGHPVFLHKGLDLEGGSEVVVAICKGPNDPPGGTCRQGLPADVDLATAQAGTITVLSQRVQGLGVSESTVQAKGSDQVVVELPGVPINKAQAVIGTTAKLHFASAVAGAANAADRTFLSDQQGLYDPKQLADATLYPTGYHWKIDSNINAKDVIDASAQYTSSSSTSKAQWAVTITFDSKGGDEWGKLTNAAYAAGQVAAGSPASLVAIFLDNQVLTAPTVLSPSTTSTQITGNFTADTATSLASQIKAGALPADITTVASTAVSATLGSDTVRRSVIAGAVGLVVVVLFMLFYYRFPGVLASIALLAYGLIVLAIYELLGVTVTLAGLAGFVLSVGMAVDANVLIFERTRDELRHGKTVPLAVDTGFRRAFPAIRDSNVSTMIACAVLFFMGSSVVKGFAVTLGLGVAVSFFSAMTITQTLFSLALRRRSARNPKLYTEIHPEYAGQHGQRSFDVVRSRNVFFGISIAVIAAGIASILAFGFNLGLDFRGGDRMDVTLNTATTQAAVAQTVNAVPGANNAVVQTTGTNAFTIVSDPASSAWLPAAVNALDQKYGIARTNGNALVSSTQVGPSIASDLVRTSVLLVLVSAAFIAIYLAFAFSKQRQISAWRFSVCTFLKLLHDVFVLAGIWAFLGKVWPDVAQVDTLFITALLTSISFSIHDTIVVFDRIRENLRVGPKLSFDQIVNLSTVQTMTRSLNTALTVTFVLLSLVLFGGSTIRGFVLALLIGIITGTYSSIFNASTLLVSWNKWDEDRKGVPQPRGGARRPLARPA